MKIGKYELHTIETGYFGLDGGAMFGVVPKPLWEKEFHADDRNRITLAAKSLLLVSDSKKILIDVGMGDKWDSKKKDIYALNQNEHSMRSSLEKLNLSLGDITDVILTHLHFDHAGGATTLENGVPKPTFPNATYHMQKGQYDWAMNPSPKDGGSFVKDDFEPLVNEGVANLMNPADTEFDENIEFIVNQGHTIDHQMVKISDGNETLLYCGDFLPTASHVKLPYLMGFDTQPLVSIEEKMKYFPIAIKENWKMYVEHDPKSSYITIKETEKGFDADELFE